jgi:hexosaminidase
MSPRLASFAFAVLASLLGALPCAGEPRIVPNPAFLDARAGEFRLRPSTPLVAPAGQPQAQRVAEIFSQLMGRTYRMPLRVLHGPPRDGAIHLRLDAGNGLADEGYRLEVSPTRVTVSAATPRGLFHGATTAWQLIERRGPGFILPAVAIADAPRFAWRGILLDSARHYQSPEYIRHFLDAMAVHKLNVLHWHLTDDQAWRLEIRKYPRLTQVGAWRVPAGAGSADIDPATGKPRLYGGFYTQETVREIVAYAAERGISVVPEIEMPGHASAALAAYPALAASGRPPATVPADWGIYPNVYSLDDATFSFLEDVLIEVIELFPGRFIHVGGDEVQKEQWLASARGKELAKAYGANGAAQLQVYFTQRIARFLESRGRRMVGWDEVLEPGLPHGAVVMSWRGSEGAVKAARQGYDTVLSAWPTLYFDNVQNAAPQEPPGRARVISLEDVYGFDPMPAGLTVEQSRHVLGIQANVWTEHIRTEERVDWMTFPRAAAVAELGWSEPGKRDWESFRRRLGAMPSRYEALGLAYAKTTFTPAAAVATSRTQRSSREMQLCTENIALHLEDDAPPRGERAIFLVDIQNPCWIFKGADLSRARAIVAAVGQVPFNFQIGEDVKKITFPAPTTPEGELEIHTDRCDGPLLARLPLAPALRSQAVTALPEHAIDSPGGIHDLCLRFAQRGVDPLWVVDWIKLVERAP